MQNSVYYGKDKAFCLKDAVKMLLKLEGISHLFSDADFDCFAMNTKNTFNQAFEIVQLFKDENKDQLKEGGYEY